MNTTIGVLNTGKAKFERTAIGAGAAYHEAAPANEPERREAGIIGVITVLPTETAAVRKILDLAPTEDGFHAGNRFGRVVCVQAREQGQGGAMDAARTLTERFSPAVLVLCGIGGGLTADVGIADVVVATTVFGYDLSKEAADGRRIRGRSWVAPAVVGRAVGDFFAGRGAPAAFPGFAAVPGLVGSGNTVLADGLAAGRRYLHGVSDKIIVADMESDGLGQFCHGAHGLNWLTVRGISDHADRAKNDDHHEQAAEHAATVLRELLPYLPKEPG